MNTDKETLESALEESSVDFDKNETEYSIGYYSSGSDIGYSILYGNEEQRLISVQISNSVWPE
jgi:hypothetical protein